MCGSEDEVLVISNGKVVTPDRIISNGQVIVVNQRITAVSEHTDNVWDAAHNRIDAGGGFILPGFIDLHVNGGGGKDITAASEEALYGIAEGHAKCGTTGLLVAVTGPSEQIAKKGLRLVADIIGRDTKGAKILGVHMEGPFINSKKQGPVFREFPDIMLPSVDKMKEFVDAGGGKLKIVTMAPELPGALPIIEYLVSQSITASIGHTEATFEQARDAFNAGVSYAAHMFNAMTGIHHRQPGTAGAILTSSNDVFIELVADGHHVHPGAIELILRSKGIGNIVLASDATELVGTSLSSFVLPIDDGLRVEVRDGRTWGPNGELIGSILQMNHAVRNMNLWFDLQFVDIIRCASLLPAKVIGMDASMGSLEPGKFADIVVLRPDFEVYTTVVNGKVVYRS